ncbi:MAG: flagellar assembly peptidoglycan hydrolase FlgJ [Betaproteobacteria bacterium]|nr:flagellar assembly peptidoglycan hydrolase FlgJ [Betaproteobacteria bacterium]
MEPSTPLLATDSRSLDALRRQASGDPRAATRAAAGQVESLFMRQMLKAMRDATPKSGMWDSNAQGTYADMFDQQLAQSLSGRPGGLADVIARQLTRQMGDAQGAGARAADAAAQAAGAEPAALASRGAVPASVVGPRTAPGLPSQAVIRQALAAFAASGGETASAQPAVQPTAQPAVPGAALAAAAAARWTEQAAAPRSPAQPDLSQLSGPQAEFVRKVWPHALLAEQKTGVPAAFIVGQAALESGWGRHEIRHGDGSPSFNLFGVKATGGWQGGSAAATTTEYVGGQPTRRVERFRAYGSYGEAFQDWASMMASSPRYSRVIQSGGSVQAFAANMQRAGYATDPAYGAKLEKTIQKTLTLQRLVT